MRTPTDASDIFKRGRSMDGMALVYMPSTPPISLILSSSDIFESRACACASMAGESDAGACAAQPAESAKASATSENKAGNDEECNFEYSLGVGFISGQG